MPDVIRTAGRYELLKQVGHGGMAVVYLARQTDLDRFVAVKELRLMTAPDPNLAHRFLREAQMAGSLSHPNIVTVHEHFEEAGTPYIAMEYLERGSLRPYIGRMTLPQIIGVLEGLLAGLDHAAHHEIVHRDLKPENLMITREGRVKIADFGIARARNYVNAGSFLTAAGTTVGTPTYMAPEQAMAKDIVAYTHLYSVGVIAYEMLVGKVPFHETETPVAILLRHINDVIPPAISANPEVDPQLSAWTERLLAKDWRDRTATPGEAWDELEDIVIGLLGSRWRRDARLPEILPQGGADRPLTPADFKASGEGSSANPSGEFKSFAWNEVPASPPTLDEFDPAPASGSAPASASASGSAAAAPASVSSEVVAPPTPAPAPAPPAEPSGFLTFGTPSVEAETPAPVVDPSVPTVPAPEVPPVAAAPVAPEPVAPEPVAPEPVAPPAPPAPVAAAPVVDEGPATVMPTVVPETAPAASQAADGTDGPRREHPEESSPGGEPAHRRRILLVAGILVAALVAGVLVGSGGGGDPEVAEASDQPATPVDGDAVRLRVPAAWSAVAPNPPAALGLSQPVAAGPSGAPQDGIVAGVVDGDVTSGLLREGAADPAAPAPAAEAVRLSPTVQALRYEGLRVAGADAPMTLYAIPTSAGVLTVACMGASAGRPACGAATTTAALAAGEPLPLDPSPDTAAALTAALEPLPAAVSRYSPALRDAKTPKGQASTARSLGQAYGAAATDVSEIASTPGSAFALKGLANALRRAGSAYEDLATAAAKGDRAGYVRAAAAVRQAGEQLTAARTALAAIGYRTEAG